MIANAKAVAHGIRAMLYVSGESRNKKHPEKITRICDNFMPQGMDATGIWTEMKFATMNHPNIKNNVIRMEISPAMEHTENFTIDDWRRLWYDFAAAFDEQEIRDKDGKVVSPRTNVSGSKSSVWLHEESKSGIPHLHAVVCRVDERGYINNDHAIHLRAQRAAEKVARQRGWTTAMRIHERNIPQVSADCMEALRELDRWSWDGYKERLAAKGYDLYLRKDKKDVIRGYVLCKSNTRFKASELGKGRNLTASRIPNRTNRKPNKQVQQLNRLPHRHRSRLFLMKPGKSHSHLYSGVTWFSRTTRTISRTASPRSLSMTARPTNAICPTRCLTSSMTSSTTKNLPTGRICRTWRWPILHCSLLLTGRFQVAVEAARSPT